MAHFTIQRTIRVFVLVPLLLLACVIDSSHMSFARAEEHDQVSSDVSDIFQVFTFSLWLIFSYQEFTSFGLATPDRDI
jgi:hypothetical protein